MVIEATKAPGLPTSSDYKYNHQFIEQNEFTDATGNLYGLNWYDFEFRTYDPQLGRWWQADPLMQHANPYLAMSNNPVLFTDPLGLWDSDVYGNEDEPYTAWRGIDENGRLLIGGTTGKIGFTLNHINFNGNYSSEQVSEQEFNQYMLNLQFIMGKTVSGLGFNQDVLAADISLNFNESAQSGGGDLSGTDKAGYGLNAFGFANGAKTELIDYALRSGSSQAGIRAELQVLGKTGTRYLQAAKGLGFMAGVAGVAVTGIDAYNKGQWQNHHTADVLIGVGSLYLLTGPVGWAVGGGYFLLDVGIKSYTGKSITENLFDKP